MSLATMARASWDSGEDCMGHGATWGVRSVGFMNAGIEDPEVRKKWLRHGGRWFGGFGGST